MSSNANIVFSFAGLPPSYCFTGFDRFALDIVEQMSGYLPGEYSVIINSDSEPDTEDRDKLWHKQLAGGAPTGKLYSFYLGLWVTPNPIEASSAMRMWWTGTEAALWAYDGGDGSDPSATAPTAVTGAMWERDTDYDFRFPLAMGTSPAPASTSVVPGDTGGAETVTLTEDQMPEHGHAMFTDSVQVGLNRVGPNEYVASDLQYSDSSYIMAETAAAVEPTLGVTGNAGGTGTDAALDIMPPYRVGMWAKRTARVYLTA